MGTPCRTEKFDASEKGHSTGDQRILPGAWRSTGHLWKENIRWESPDGNPDDRNWMEGVQGAEINNRCQQEDEEIMAVKKISAQGEGVLFDAILPSQMSEETGRKGDSRTSRRRWGVLGNSFSQSKT